ncbi:hypothetical protein E4U57_007000, partial [Claviceps arundinis]
LSIVTSFHLVIFLFFAACEAPGPFSRGNDPSYHYPGPTLETEDSSNHQPIDLPGARPDLRLLLRVPSWPSSGLLAAGAVMALCGAAGKISMAIERAPRLTGAENSPHPESNEGLW